MAQRLFPVGINASDQTWTPAGGASVHECIDEFPFSDVDSAASPALAYFDTDQFIEFDLSGITDPGVNTGFTFRLRSSLAVTGSVSDVQCVPRLRQLGSDVWVGSSFSMPGGVATTTVAIPSGDIAAITNFNLGQLSIRLEMAVTAGIGGTWQVVIYGQDIEAPDAGFTHLDRTTPGGFAVVANATGHYLIRDSGGIRRVAGLEGATALILSGRDIKEHG